MTTQTEKHIDNCNCDECWGACKDGTCGWCFICEEISDQEKSWEANQNDFYDFINKGE